MTGKEALKRLLCMAKKGCKADMCNVKYVENASDIIKQDLERLEELEKMLDLHDVSNMFKNCSKLEPLPELEELKNEN